MAERRNRRNREDRSQSRKKGGGIGGVISTLVLVIALGVFCYAGYQLFTIYMDYKVGTDEYAAIEESVKSEGSKGDEGVQKVTEGFQEEEMEANHTLGDEWGDVVLDEAASGKKFEEMENPVDFVSLKEINEDVIGWLEMEAIDVSYPIAQGGDNNYYLHRTVQKTDNFAGSIFLDFQNHSNFGDRNSIVYGHNMKNGSMFGMLRKYREKETLEKSPYFWIYTPDYIYKYEIFSCAEVDQYSEDYQIAFPTRESFERFLERTTGQSLVDTGVVMSYGDTVVTLSTCTGNEATRFIVQGKRIRTYKAVNRGNER